MKNYSTILIGLVAAATVFAGCDLLDPTHADNPDVTETDFLNRPKAAQSWVAGMDRQMSITLGALIVPAEIASDNYVNTYSFYNQFMDRLDLHSSDRDVEAGLLEISKLREMAEFGLDVVASRDPETTGEQRAELWFYKGMAHLYTGEWWHSAPADSAGPPRSSVQQFDLAIEALGEAVALHADAGYHIALARAYRNLGDADAAAREAETALAMDADYVRFARFDQVNGPDNAVQNALYDRGSYDDLQPLARLDYLDPKFFVHAAPAGGDDESASVAYVKSEEAYMILAEARIAAGDLSAARESLGDLLAVVGDRKRVEVVDGHEDRSQVKPGARPNSKEWLVAAGPGDAFREGLVVSRDEPVPVSVVSGTGVTHADIDSIDSEDTALELLYLMRQEIFIAEGRRMHDLGIQWPVPQVEVLNNPNLTDGPATQGRVPAFLPPGSEFDAFESIDYDKKRVVLKHDLNKILVQNKHAADVMPFQ